MKRLALLCLLLAAGCNPDTPAPKDYRDAVAVEFAAQLVLDQDAAASRVPIPDKPKPDGDAGQMVGAKDGIMGISGATEAVKKTADNANKLIDEIRGGQLGVHLSIERKTPLSASEASDLADPYAGKTVLLFFTARSCGPCRGMVPIIDSLASQGYNAWTADAAVRGDLFRKYGVRLTPSFVLVKDGKEQRRITGSTTEQVLKELLDE